MAESSYLSIGPRWRPTFAQKREIIKARRERARLAAEGFVEIEGPWEINVGGRYREQITEVRIDPTGKSVWVRTAEPPPTERDE